jgi:hypothetical protein
MYYFVVIGIAAVGLAVEYINIAWLRMQGWKTRVSAAPFVPIGFYVFSMFVGLVRPGVVLFVPSGLIILSLLIGALVMTRSKSRSRD